MNWAVFGRESSAYPGIRPSEDFGIWVECHQTAGSIQDEAIWKLRKGRLRIHFEPLYDLLSPDHNPLMVTGITIFEVLQ